MSLRGYREDEDEYYDESWYRRQGETPRLSDDAIIDDVFRGMLSHME